MDARRGCVFLSSLWRWALGAGLLTTPLAVLSLHAEEPSAEHKDAIPNSEPARSPAEQRKWAVVIGVTRYLNQDIPAFEYGVPDARLMYTALVERAGYDAERVLLIADDQSKAHLRPLGVNLRTQVSTWLKRAGADDTVLVFYAGRAIVDREGHAFLASQEYDRNRPQATSLPIETLRDMLAECRARYKLVILAAGPPSQVLAEALQTVDGLTALACCRKTENFLVWKDKKQTLFSDYVARGLSGEADADGDRVVDSQELCHYVVKQVQAAGAKGPVGQTPLEVSGKGITVVPLAGVSPGLENMSRVEGARSGSVEQRETQRGTLRTGQFPKRISNSIGMGLVLIPAGEFMMGSPKNEIGHKDDESPVHKVQISKPFYMGVYEVTRGEFAKVMRGYPEFDGVAELEKQWKGVPYWDAKQPANYLDSGDYPQIYISWENATRFCRRLGAMPAERRAGRKYRLPTEAEWEYACRAGNTLPFNFGGEPDTELLSFNGDRYGRGLKSKPKPLLKVGCFQANAFGLFDMHGNAREWCSDYYKSTYYAGCPAEDPMGPIDAKPEVAHVLRGGTCGTGPEDCRSAARKYATPLDHGTYLSGLGGVYIHDFYGFRVVCEP